MFLKTDKQKEAVRLLGGSDRHVLLYGGSRSGKTAIIIYALVARALKCKSRHAILRLHFNHVKQSVWLDTLPKVMDLIDPNLRRACKWNQSDWFIQLPNGSEIWIGGLDDRERTEKILGREFSTIFFNECSEISLESRDIALTRLSEKNDLVKRALYDCNPPKMSHWTFVFFVEKTDFSGNPVEGYACLRMNPVDNRANIDPEYISQVLEKLPPLLKNRFLSGEFGSDEKDIFKPEWLLPCNMPSKDDIAAVFAFCDPAFTEASRAKDNTCESAIVVLGVTYDNRIIDLEFQHGFWEYQELKARCKNIFEIYKAYPELYFGAEDVQAQKWLISDLNAMGLNCLGQTPDHDKVRRAISITDILAEGRARINDLELRKQLLSFPTGKLKDGTDAYVYALRLYKKFRHPYKDPRIEDDFMGLDNDTYQRQRVEKFQERARRRAKDRAKGGSDPTLGRRW
jgi:phage terminase large subunit-like protein